MAETSPPLRSPPSGAQRPKGILKNPIASPSHEQDPISPMDSAGAQLNDDPISLNDGPRRPSLPHMTASEKEITKANTLANAGVRRNSSNARSSTSRRHSQTSQVDADGDENAMRLKWDEANIFLHEQDRGSTMKIDEPKTPFVREQDVEDMEEDEPASIDPNGLHVDELDKSNAGTSNGRGRKKGGDEIPGLDLGEAEEPLSDPALRRSDSTDKRRVVVDEEPNADPVHEPESLTADAKRKHQAFEDKRKKHYEIPAGVVLGQNAMDVDEVDEVRPRVPTLN